MQVDAIAQLSTTAGSAVVDVGCGDGALLPHLTRAGAAPSSYLGVDISARMVELAAAAHPSATFVCADFLTLKPTATFDCVLLNGASQFFADQAQLAAAAAAWVRPGGLIVFSHAQGAAFVADEHRGNPAVARSCLPTPQQLAAIAEEQNMEVLPTTRCVPDDSAALPTPHTLEGEHFYLVALQTQMVGANRDGEV